MRTQRIFVTGGSGFIGNYLLSALDRENQLFHNYDLVNGDDIKNRFEIFKNMELFQPDVVVHLAAQAGVRRSELFKKEYLLTNVMGTKNVVSACEEFGVNKFIYFSSSSVYGENDKAKREEDLKNPISWYGMTKSWAEEIVLVSNIPNCYVIRPFTVYGMNGRNDQVIYKWINQIRRGLPISKFGNGDSVRGYTHVEDLVDGVIKCINSSDCRKEIVNLGGSEAVSLNRLINLFKQACNELQVNEMDLPKCDVKQSVASIEKAKQILDWGPKRNFEAEVIKILEQELQ